MVFHSRLWDTLAALPIRAAYVIDSVNIDKYIYDFINFIVRMYRLRMGGEKVAAVGVRPLLNYLKFAGM